MGFLNSRVIPAACILLLAGGCQSLQVSDIRQGDVYPLTAAERGRTNTSESDIALPLEELWEYDANAGFGVGGPLVLGEFLIALNRKGEVHAVDINSGRKLGLERFGEAINGDAVLADGVLFVPLDHGSRRTVMAWDLRSGSAKWRADGAHAVATALTLTPGSVIAVDRSSTFTAYDKEGGSVIWSANPLAESPISASPVSTSEGDLIVATTRGQVARVSGADGSVLWSAEFGEPVYSTPAANETSAFVTGARGGIAKIDLATGIMVWKRELTRDDVKLTSPAVSDDVVVVAGTDGLARALRQNSGEVIWDASVEYPVVAAPLLSSTNVFIGTLGRTIVALDRTDGVLEWRDDLKGRVKSAMTTRNGDLYVMTEPRYVYRFGTADTSEVAAAE